MLSSWKRRSRRSFVHASLAALFAVHALSSAAIAAAADPLADGVMKTMNASVVAWSSGDLNAFMDSYEDGADTSFVASSGLVRGKAAIAARYAAQFGQAGPGQLGNLAFETLEIRPLGEHYALMVGRFRLQPADRSKPEASGIFTLVFHERDGRWRIVSDHTS